MTKASAERRLRMRQGQKVRRRYTDGNIVLEILKIQIDIHVKFGVFKFYLISCQIVSKQDPISGRQPEANVLFVCD